MGCSACGRKYQAPPAAVSSPPTQTAVAGAQGPTGAVMITAPRVKITSGGSPIPTGNGPGFPEASLVKKNTE